MDRSTQPSYREIKAALGAQSAQVIDMERYGHVIVKAFTERVDGPGLEAVVVNYKELHNQVIHRLRHILACTPNPTRIRSWQYLPCTSPPQSVSGLNIRRLPIVKALDDRAVVPMAMA